MKGEGGGRGGQYEIKLVLEENSKWRLASDVLKEIHDINISRLVVIHKYHMYIRGGQLYPEMYIPFGCYHEYSTQTVLNFLDRVLLFLRRTR